jgi:hypothetical protein
MSVVKNIFGPFYYHFRVIDINFDIVNLFLRKQGFDLGSGKGVKSAVSVLGQDIFVVPTDLNGRPTSGPM